jgi:hypothetical protein
VGFAGIELTIMAKRFTDTELWDKEWFMALPMKLKLLTRLVYDKCDASGVWSPNWSLASQYIGEKLTEKDLEKIAGQFEKLPDGKIFVTGFIVFQYGELSEKCKPHQKIFSLLKKHGLLERVLKGYTYPLHRVEEKEEEKEEEEEKDKEEEARKNHVRWTEQMLDGQDFVFQQMLMRERFEMGEATTHWILDHRDLLRRYPNMRPRDQQDFRQSCLKHIRENIKKNINGTAKKFDKNDRTEFNNGELNSILAHTGHTGPVGH